MADEVPERLGALVGHGTVYLAYREPSGQPPGWYGYWDAAEVDTGAAPAYLEDAGYFPTTTAAVSWGRSRSVRIVLQDGQGRHFWAGTAPMPDDPDLAGLWVEP